MFTGIIEGTATVKAIHHIQDNIDFVLTCPFTDELSVAQSLAHDGVCLTITKIEGQDYTVTAMRETLLRTDLGKWEPGTLVNIERSMPANGRFDGHIVQGHVDTTAECIALEDASGSYIYTFRYPFDPAMVKRGYFCADKGSVTVNGVSLTVCNPTDDTFQVNIIPFTYEHTNFQSIRPGTIVNIEFDILGKLVARMQQLR
ncbi:MAG: riboflavin synthase [Bacteroidaceae bacterium]|nr:riboflavin synthase [Bacteroidaceae bacterium]